MSADLVRAYERANSPTAALRALDAIAAAPDARVPFELAVEYDEVAAELADADEFALAAGAQRRALELGYDGDPDGRELLAWYLLRTGERDEPRRLFDELRAERGPADVSTDLLASDAYIDSGLVDEGLEALDRAVDRARSGGADDEDLAEALVQRMEARREFGREEDDDDRVAATLVVAPGPVLQPAVAWFPADQIAAALDRWPDLAEELADPAAYNRSIEQDARDVTDEISRKPAIVPVVVDAFVGWAPEPDPSGHELEALHDYAADRLAVGDGIAWPPGRNDPCWCGSGRKYKKCCGG